MSTFIVGRNLTNTYGLDYLRKGRCPWCLEKLTPVFERDAHVADECLYCDDVFKEPPR